MRPLGREQHGGDTGPAPGQPGSGIQGVTPVVPAPDEQHDPTAVHPPQQVRAGGGESGRGPLHERALRQPSHQLLLGRPDRFHAVRSTHVIESAAELP